MSLACPLGDLGLLVLLSVGLAASGRRASPGLRRLIAGLLVMLASDAIYVQQATESTYRFGSLVSAGWLVGMGLLAAAAWRPAPTDASQGTAAPSCSAPCWPPGSRSPLLIPDRVNAMATTLAAAAIALAGLRLLLSVREVAALAAQGQEARTDDLTALPNRRRVHRGRRRGDRDRGAAALRRPAHRPRRLPRAQRHAGPPHGRRPPAPRGRAPVDGAPARRPARPARRRRVRAAHGARDHPGRCRGSRAARARGARGPLRARAASPSTPTAASASPCTRDHAADAAELLRHVDIAMYRAKRGRLGVATFSPDLDVHSRDRLELLGELRRGIASGQLVLHFQPKVRLRDGSVDGFEALVRWQHPARGLLFPDAFVDVVEQTEPARAHDVARHRAGPRALRDPRDVGVAVNVSSASLSDPELVGAVRAALARWDIAGHRLTVEITESAIIDDLPRAVALLEALRALGVRIAIDDYGTGHSSLAYLHRLPADELKIDRAFVADLDSDPRRAAIVRLDDRARARPRAARRRRGRRDRGGLADAGRARLRHGPGLPDRPPRRPRRLPPAWLAGLAHRAAGAGPRRPPRRPAPLIAAPARRARAVRLGRQARR